MSKPKQEITFIEKRQGVHEELLLDGESVSEMVIWKRDMRIGTTTVKMGGIGGVSTKPKHRKKGYASLLMHAGMRHMREHDFDVSVLFGINNFYHRWRFAPCMPAPTITIATRDAEKATGRYRVRPARDADMTGILRIYHRNNHGRTGPLCRPRRDWRGFRLGSRYHVKPVPYVISRKEKDQIVGYFVMDDSLDRCAVSEIGFGDFDVFPTIMKTFAREAITRRVEHIEVHVPPDHPFVEHAILYGARATQVYHENGEAMAAIINQRSLFERMLPELTARLQSSALAAWSGKFAVITDLETTIFSVRGGCVKLSPRSKKLTGRLELPQERLVQLVMGYRTVSSVASDPGVRLRGNVEPILSVLFAKGFPYIWPADRF